MAKLRATANDAPRQGRALNHALVTQRPQRTTTTGFERSETEHVPFAARLVFERPLGIGDERAGQPRGTHHGAAPDRTASSCGK
ncbi:hypothetical protein ACWDSF_26920, partial [Nocardia beijingensis]